MAERGVATLARRFQDQTIRYHRAGRAGQSGRAAPETADTAPCLRTLSSTCSLIRMSDPPEHQVDGVLDVILQVAEIGHFFPDDSGRHTGHIRGHQTIRVTSD